MNVTTQDKKEGILRWSRDALALPALYTIKIESFSQLSKSGIKKYESNIFESGGYKWKFLLYPNGDDSKNGDDHISLYLVMADTSSLLWGREVHVCSRLYLFDQVRDKYVTSEEVGGLKSFNEMKTEWGFSKFIPLTTFNDPANGYLVDDTCVFGVDVFVYNSYKNGECFSLVENLTTIKHTWKIKRFSQFEDCCYSDVFTAGEQKWHIKFFPKGEGDQSNKDISIYLCFANKASLPSGLKVYLEYDLRVNDQKFDGKHTDLAIKDVDWFSASASGWGYGPFMDLCDLKDPTKGYLVNDTCIIEAEITVLGIVK